MRKHVYAVSALILFAGFLDTAVAQNNSFQATPSQLVFNMPQAGVMPGQNSAQLNLSTTLAGSSVPFSTTTPSWLSVSPATGIATPTATVLTATLTANTTSLANGAYTGAITVFQAGSGQPVPSLSIPVTLNVGNQLTITPSTTVNLSYQSGQTPPSATLNVGGSVGSLPFTIGNIQPAASWLQPSVAPNATTPGTISVNINPTTLNAGNYTGTFVVSSSASGVTPVTITVNLTVSPSPTLSASPQSLSFAYQTGTSTGPLPSKTVTLTTNGGPVGFTIDPSPQSWLTINANGTSASQSQPATLTITVNPNSPTVLAPNTYTANITIRPVGGANTGPITIPVSLLVSASPLLILGNAPNTFNYQIGGAPPADQTISIASSSTTSPVDYTVTDKPSWLDILPGSGTTSLVTSLTLHVSTTVLPTLGTGNYQGTVTVKSTLAGNSPVTFPVSLTVAFTPSLSTTIGGLTFNYQTTTGQQPGGQFFTVNSTGAPLPVSAPAASSTECGGAWLTASTANTTTQATVYVTVNTTGVTAPNTCHGNISIQSGTSAPLSVPVILNVSANPLLNVTAQDLVFTAPLGSTTVLQKTIQLNSTDNTTSLNYTITSDQPWLSTNLNGASSTGVSPSFVVFVNPAVLIQAGTYTGNLTVTNGSANPAGSQPAQKLQVTLTIASNVTLTLQPPSPLNITVPVGGQAVTQSVALTLSSGTAGFTATATSAQGWLKLSMGGGAPTNEVGGTAPANITVIADPTSVGLAQGNYQGTVTITAPGLQTSTVTLTVNLTVGPVQTLSLSAPSVSFTLNAGATGNATQQFSVTSTGGPVNFTITKGTTGCDAISVSPTTGTTGTAPVPIAVTLNQTGLTAGTIACTLTVAGPQGSGIQSQTLIVNVNVGAVLIPQITALVNAASYAPGPVAPGEVVTIFGTNLGPMTLTTYILNNNQFATTVAGVQVLFDNVPAPILYVRNDQASVVVPFEIAGRTTTSVTIKLNGQTSAALQMNVVNYVPGLFTLNQQGSGQGAIINQDGTVNGQQNPAPKGSVVALYLAGAGTFTSNVPTGSVAMTPVQINADVTVTIGGQAAQVQYKGAAGAAIAGLYQFNVLMPDNMGSGSQPLVVTVGGQPAQSNVTVYVQ